MNERQQKVLAILSEISGKPTAQLGPEIDIKDDLQLDSAQILELLAEIEETFDLDISEVQAAKVKTVADLLQFTP